MKDASDLVDAIAASLSGRQTLQQAITTYEDEMRPRGAKEVALSYEQAMKSKDWGKWSVSPLSRVGHRRA